MVASSTSGNDELPPLSPFLQTANFASMAVCLDLGGTGAHQIGESSAQFAALAHLPADAHFSLVVFLDSEVALEVAVKTDGDALKARGGTLAVCLRAEGLFAGGPAHLCCLVGVFLAVGEAAADLGVDGGGLGGVFGLLKVGAEVDVLVENQVVQVRSLAHVYGDFRGIELLGCETLLEVTREHISM
jgi:hypothetical protein